MLETVQAAPALMLLKTFEFLLCLEANERVKSALKGDSVQHWKSRFEKNIFLRSLNVCLCIIKILNDEKMS